MEPFSVACFQKAPGVWLYSKSQPRVHLEYYTKEKPTEFRCCFKACLPPIILTTEHTFHLQTGKGLCAHKTRNRQRSSEWASPLHHVRTWKGKAKLRGRDFRSSHFPVFLCKQQTLRGSAVFHVLSIFWVPCLSTSLKMPWVCMKMKGLWISINPRPTANLIIFWNAFC